MTTLEEIIAGKYPDWKNRIDAVLEEIHEARVEVQGFPELGTLINRLTAGSAIMEQRIKGRPVQLKKSPKDK